MFKNVIKFAFDKMGYAVTRKLDSSVFYQGPDSGFKEIYERCKDYTMTSVERMYALYKAVEYVTAHRIPGDIVECGAWRGGSIMLCALVLKNCNDMNRKLYLYDTYAGMSEPGDGDVDFYGESARQKWQKRQAGDINQWCYASLEEVRQNVFSIGYPREKFIFVKGRVEDTIPKLVPDSIALLRLDTDWYASTYHELRYLFPRLTAHGVVILDDYGAWRGATEAADRYFRENNTRILLHVLDRTGRIGIKT